jgi:hypothetical protein
MFYCLLQGRRRPYHLKSYNATDLGALTGQSYAFATVDDHLREAMTLHLARPMGDALARRYYQTWYQTPTPPQASLESYVFYLDAHEKPVFSKKPVPVGRIKGQPGACLRQVFLHGRRGHTLYCQTYPGDVKLSKVAKDIITDFEKALGHKAVYVVVIDREGMSLPLFSALADMGVYIVTLLKSNQYKGKEDFLDLSQPKPLVDERTSQLTHTVSQGYLPTEKGRIRCAVSTDLDKDRLVVFATTVPQESQPDILCIARWYLSRWSAQENVFRYLVDFVDLDINFGINKKTPVVNRQVHRKVEELEGRVSVQNRRLDNKHKQLLTLHQKIARVKERQAIELAKLSGKRLQERGTTARQEKQQRYSERLSKYAVQEAVLLQKIDEHQRILAKLHSKRTSLNEQAPLYEVDPEKDQIMTHLKVALANSALYAREHYFGQKYARALPQTLYRIFFGQGGYVEESAKQIKVTLDSYRDPVLQVDVQAACKAFTQRQIRTFDGKLIRISVDDCK